MANETGSKRTILLTGFGPFAGSETNPAETVARRVADNWNGPGRLVAEILPVEFKAAGDRMLQLIDLVRPDAVLSIGLAAGRDAVSIERVALNLMDAQIPDNAGQQPVDVPSVPGQPTAILATAPVKRLAQVIGDAGIAVELSLSAGSYVCNHVFATASFALPAGRVGFVHIPWAEENGVPDVPALPMSALVQAVTLACQHVFSDEVSTPAGAVS